MTPRYTHTLTAAALVCIVSIFGGCASSSPSSPSAERAKSIAQDASEQIARMQAEDARRLREALALGEEGDRAFAEAIALSERGKDDQSREAFADAVNFYSQAVSTYDEFFALWNNLGTALAALDRYQQAEEAYIRASNINHSDPRPWYNRGLLWRNRGYPADAKRYFEQALERDPRYLDALWGVIKADITLGEESHQTLELIRKTLFLETNPEHRQFLELERGRIRSKLGISESSPRQTPEPSSPPAENGN
ncbi:MAG: tetratricopeptide repeat protein [Phycisphaerales bacterium JB065]